MVIRNMEFLTSIRGRRILVLDQYMFQFAGTTREKSHWRCSNRNCRVRVHLVNDVLDSLFGGTHNHENHRIGIIRSSFIQKLRKKIKDNPTVSISKLYKSEIAASISEGTVDHLPCYETTKKNLQKTKLEAMKLSCLSKSLADTTHPESQNAVEDDTDSIIFADEISNKQIYKEKSMVYSICEKMDIKQEQHSARDDEFVDDMNPLSDKDSSNGHSVLNEAPVKGKTQPPAELIAGPSHSSLNRNYESNTVCLGNEREPSNEFSGNKNLLITSTNQAPDKDDVFDVFAKDVAIQLRQLPLEMALEGQDYINTYLMKARMMALSWNDRNNQPPANSSQPRVVSGLFSTVLANLAKQSDLNVTNVNFHKN